MILSSFKSSLENLHNFHNPFNNSKYKSLNFIENPSLNLFAINNGKCLICYLNIYIPTYIQNCTHSFCYCCLWRWINCHNSCPLCRQQINQIGYLDSKAKDGKIIINASQLKINSSIIQNKEPNDSVFCLVCKKTEPCNQLLLCKNCRYNLVHIKCQKLEWQDLQNYICDNCNKKNQI